MSSDRFWVIVHDRDKSYLVNHGFKSQEDADAERDAQAGAVGDLISERNFGTEVYLTRAPGEQVVGSFFLRAPITVDRTRPERGDTRIRVGEDDPRRTWRPEEKMTDAQLNTVFDILIERRYAPQAEIAEELGVRLELKKGTAAAATSAALLWLREAGVVRVDDPQAKTPEWALDE